MFSVCSCLNANEAADNETVYLHLSRRKAAGVVEMMSSRSRLSVLTVGLFIGFLVYVVINSQLDSSQFRPVFSSRSLMNHAPQQVSTTSNNIDLISNAGLISAIDQLVTSISTY